ncbi:MAG: hypothetical protein ACD_37C00679G0002 [uncultured bacterium]|nr:MAG: hypothetical protein ACD_37C00679G0002 [uncultured bacterium]
MREYVENRVIELRKNQDITQEQFAKAIGVTRQTVIAIEKGAYAPSVILALKISKYFNLPLEKIFIYKYEK